jgi:hypothetical protein
VAVCEEISKKIKQAGTLKIRKAPSVQCKIQGIEASFREAHDWVNNTGVGVLASDGPISFEETVKKKFIYYYDLVDVMCARASARPRASTDTMKMSGDDDDDDDDSSSSSPLSVKDKDEEEDDHVSAEKRAEAKEEEEEDDGYPTPSYPTPPGSPSPIGAGTTGAIMAINSSAFSTVTSSLTTDTVPVGGKKRKEKTAAKDSNSKKKKARKTNKKAGYKSSPGSYVNPHEIDGGDDDSWQVSMLDIRRGEVELQKEKWNSQKEQHTMDVQLQQEKWAAQKQQQNLEYKFDLMVKYKKLQEQGFDNHQIVGLIPDMRPILDTANMPVHVQLEQEGPSQQDGADE